MYAHFLQKHFQFATDICSFDITSAAIALRLCFELLDDEINSFINKEISESDRDALKSKKKKISDMLEKLDHCAHFQYYFSDNKSKSKYQGSISSSKFLSAHKLCFELIKWYFQSVNIDAIDLIYHEPSSLPDTQTYKQSVKELFEEYVDNFQRYRRELPYSCVAVVNFRKSLEAFLQVKMLLLKKENKDITYNVNQNKYGYLDALIEVFFNKEKGYASFLEVNERGYIVEVVRGGMKRSDSVFNQLCHFKTKKEILWDAKKQRFKKHEDRIELIIKDLDKYRKWFDQQFREWLGGVDGEREEKSRPVPSLSDQKIVSETEYIDESDVLESDNDSYHQRNVIQNNKSRKQAFLITFAVGAFIILLIVGFWFGESQDSSPQKSREPLERVIATKTQILTVQKSIPKESKVFTLNVTVDRHPESNQTKRLYQRAKDILTKTANEEGYKRIVGQPKPIVKNAKCNSSKCSLIFKGTFVR